MESWSARTVRLLSLLSDTMTIDFEDKEDCNCASSYRQGFQVNENRYIVLCLNCGDKTTVTTP